MLVCGVINTQTRELSKDLASAPVACEMVEHQLSGLDIVLAVFDDVIPLTLRNRLIPREVVLLVLDSELNLPLLERLLLRREVVNISIREVVCLTERCVLLVVDDALRDLEDVVVLLPVVESNQPEIEQRLHCLG